MRRTVSIAALAVAMVAGQASADSLNHTIAMTADVPSVCAFDSGPTNAGSAFSGITGGASTFTVEIDPVSGKVVTTNDTLTFTNAYCNTSSEITFTRSGLSTDGTAPLGFSNVIAYQASLNWGGPLATLPLGGTNTFSGTVGPKAGDLTLEILVPEDGLLLPGIYTDTLSLTIAPPA